MPLSATTVKADPEKLELAKLKGINISKLFREALDLSLLVPGSDREMLLMQLAKVRKNMRMLSLEEKLILDQLAELESEEEINSDRETKYLQWKTPIARQVKKNNFDWDSNTKYFQFPNKDEFRKWLMGKLKEDDLI